MTNDELTNRYTVECEDDRWVVFSWELNPHSEGEGYWKAMRGFRTEAKAQAYVDSRADPSLFCVAAGDVEEVCTIRVPRAVLPAGPR